MDLAERLRPLAEGDITERVNKETAFREFVDKEVAEMSRSTYGQPLMHAVGSAYTLQAQIFLGTETSLLGIDGGIASMKQSMRQKGHYFDVASKGYKSISAVKVRHGGKRSPAIHQLITHSASTRSHPIAHLPPTHPPNHPPNHSTTQSPTQPPTRYPLDQVHVGARGGGQDGGRKRP